MIMPNIANNVRTKHSKRKDLPFQETKINGSVIIQYIQ